MPREHNLPPGMWRRGKVYYARFRAGGRLVRLRLSSNFEAAREMLNDLRARADRADYGLYDNNYSWEKLRKEFLQWAGQSVRDPQKYEQDLDKFEAYVRVNNIREIDHQTILGFRAWRLAEGVTPRTINRQVGTLSNMLTKAVKWKRIGSNPLVDLEPLKHDSPKKIRRSLTVAEVQAVFEASPEYLRPVWRTFMTTGLRRNEVVQMRFGDVDFERKVVVVRAGLSKNHKPREVPLEDVVLAEILTRRDAAKQRQPMPGGTVQQTEQQRAKFSQSHVFVTKANTPLVNNLLSRFYAICKKAGIEGAERGGSVDLHSLRVTFITLSIEYGGNPKAVQALVGHSSLAMTMGVYAKATDTAKRDAIGVLPFATVTPPDHVVSMQAAHKLRTKQQASPESKMA